MSDPRESEYREQLVLLRDVFRMSGALHEAQALQLRYLPRICIGHSTKSEVAIRFTPGETKQPRVVTITAEVAGREPKKLRKALEKLDEWVKFLVGSDFEVVIKYGGKTFRSPGKKLSNGTSTHQPRDEEPSRTAHPRRTRRLRAVPPQR